MGKIWRVEEEQIMKAGKITGTNYTVWYKDENGARTARRDYREGQYKVIPMTVLNFILDENNEARTRYQEFDGNTYKRTTYQQSQEAPQEAPAAEAEQQPTETENAPQAATQAAEGIEITAITYTTDDGPDPAPGLLIHRPGTARGIIIGDGVMLPDDPADMLTAYGEREYNRDAAGNYIITDGKKQPATVTDNTPATPPSGRKEKTMKYVIEIIGAGNRRRYCIKRVTVSKMVIPVDGRVYRTEDDARSAANAQGLKIEAIGDLWHII